MGKLFVFNLMSLDGFFARPNGDLDWHVTDDEFNQFAEEQLEELDALLFGRVTYELMASYWRSPEARESDPGVAARMNRLPKFVFSRTLRDVDWENSNLVGDDAADAVSRIKQEFDRSIAIFGSANFTSSLIPEGLIDEFRILVNPVVLGEGKPMFVGVGNTLKLHLAQTRTFATGNVLLTYEALPTD